jgi:uncharacterized protein (TIGR03000 family)
MVLAAALSGGSVTPAWGHFHSYGCWGGVPVRYGCAGCYGAMPISYGCWGGRTVGSGCAGYYGGVPISYGCSGCWGGVPVSYGCYGGVPISYGCWGGRTVRSGCWGGRPLSDNAVEEARSSRPRPASGGRTDPVSTPRTTVMPYVDDEGRWSDRTDDRPSGRPAARRRLTAQRPRSLPPASSSRPATLVVQLPAAARLTINGHRISATSATRTFVSRPLQAGKEYAYTLKADLGQDDRQVTVRQRVTLRAGEERRVLLKFPRSGEVARE